MYSKLNNIFSSFRSSIDNNQNIISDLSEGLFGTIAFIWLKYNLTDEVVHWSIALLSTLSLGTAVHYWRMMLKHFDEKRAAKKKAKEEKEKKDKLDKLGVII